MDLRYATALRNATNAWAQNRVTDSLTLQELRRSPNQQQQPQRDHPATPGSAAATPMAHAQPELARGVARGVLHKNTASRKMSRLSKRVASL